jgi:hypothetical protein
MIRMISKDEEPFPCKHHVLCVPIYKGKQRQESLSRMKERGKKKKKKRKEKENKRSNPRM